MNENEFNELASSTLTETIRLALADDPAAVEWMNMLRPTWRTEIDLAQMNQYEDVREFDGSPDYTDQLSLALYDEW